MDSFGKALCELSEVGRSRLRPTAKSRGAAAGVRNRRSVRQPVRDAGAFGVNLFLGCQRSTEASDSVQS